MEHPNDSHDANFRAGLPPELQQLDEELSAIRIEERPSFAPELEGELVKAWRAGMGGETHKSRRWIRTLMVAGLAGLMVTGVSVPSARGMVAQLIRTVVEEAFPASEPPEPGPDPEMTGQQIQNPVVPSENTAGERVISSPEAQPGGDALDMVQSELPEIVITFPEILHRGHAERLISLRYPLALQRAGVGGAVKLMFWVDEEGIPENIQMREGSGYLSLNRAAMLAARELRFRPATRNGEPVGTWVEFDIHFVPGSGAGIGNPGPAGSDGIGGG